MKSRQTSNSKDKFLLIAAFSILAVLSWRFFPTPGEYLAEKIFRPLLNHESNLYTTLRSDGTSLEENEKVELDYLRAENSSLRDVMGENTRDRIAAGVIGRPTALPYDILLIDKGESEGILKDAPVYATKDTVIGFVAAVYQNSSLVALLSTPSFTSTAYILGPNIYTTAVGIGGGVTRIHVPQGIELNVGDLVVLPSLSKGVYGRISAIDSVPERPEQYGYLTTDLPINSLKIVSIGSAPLNKISFEEAKNLINEAKRDFLMIDVPVDVLVDIETSSTTDNATSTEENTNQ